MSDTEIVAVAFLTRPDLEAFGSNLSRVFEVASNEDFDTLLSCLNDVPAVAPRSGATPIPRGLSRSRSSGVSKG
jgi:hypothetical protein